MWGGMWVTNRLLRIVELAASGVTHVKLVSVIPFKMVGETIGYLKSWIFIYFFLFIRGVQKARLPLPPEFVLNLQLLSFSACLFFTISKLKSKVQPIF